ncbi:MAG: four helix bundle protein [Caldithrix sp.]|nr:MAG: four helix bundle protein [Caldithrix sp.]
MAIVDKLVAHNREILGNWNIWKGGIAIVKQVYRLAEFLPVEAKYGLGQLNKEQKMINNLNQQARG